LTASIEAAGSLRYCDSNFSHTLDNISIVATGWRFAVGGIPARKDSGIMSNSEERIEDRAGPLLRMFRGEENDLDGAGEADFEDNSTEKRLEAEVEAFWAGRIPANRHSARVAA
jgi:hypothetical protein